MRLSLPCRASVRSSLLCLALLTAPVASLRAQAADSARTSVGQAIRATRAPEIDGRDRDAVWRAATPMTAFRQFEPSENGEPTFRTEARAA